jgi:branched-chain amino acid transport system ATP-binding protein
MNALLQLEKVSIRFGGLTAVAELDLQIGENELVGLIGPNGAGKTTVFNLITGVYQPTSGKIFFANKPLSKLKPFGSLPR